VNLGKLYALRGLVAELTFPAEHTPGAGRLVHTGRDGTIRLEVVRQTGRGLVVAQCLDDPTGLRLGLAVFDDGRVLEVPRGGAAGRVFDPGGVPLDDLGPIDGPRVPVLLEATDDLLFRARGGPAPLASGWPAVDALCPLVRGGSARVSAPPELVLALARSIAERAGATLVCGVVGGAAETVTAAASAGARVVWASAATAPLLRARVRPSAEAVARHAGGPVVLLHLGAGDDAVAEADALHLGRERPRAAHEPVWSADDAPLLVIEQAPPPKPLRPRSFGRLGASLDAMRLPEPTSDRPADVTLTLRATGDDWWIDPTASSSPLAGRELADLAERMVELWAVPAATRDAGQRAWLGGALRRLSVA
jgi:hypothetical protein